MMSLVVDFIVKRDCMWWLKTDKGSVVGKLILIANGEIRGTIIFRYFLARNRNFPPQIDWNIHQAPRDSPHAFCFGDIGRHDSIHRKIVKSKPGKIIIKLYFSENILKNNHFKTKMDGKFWIIDKKVMTNKRTLWTKMKFCNILLIRYQGKFGGGVWY